MFEGVADAEQKQQQRPFRPGPERSCAGGGNQHQAVDLEPPLPQGLDRFSQGEEAACHIGGEVTGQGDRSGRSGHDRNEETDRQKSTRQQRKDQFGVRAEQAARCVLMVRVALF